MTALPGEWFDGIVAEYAIYNETSANWSGMVYVSRGNRLDFDFQPALMGGPSSPACSADVHIGQPALWAMLPVVEEPSIARASGETLITNQNAASLRSQELIELARLAAASLDRNDSIDIDEWAMRLARDIGELVD